jgi:hypothetical protein
MRTKNQAVSARHPTKNHRHGSCTAHSKPNCLTAGIPRCPARAQVRTDVYIVQLHLPGTADSVATVRQHMPNRNEAGKPCTSRQWRASMPGNGACKHQQRVVLTRRQQKEDATAAVMPKNQLSDCPQYQLSDCPQCGQFCKLSRRSSCV